MLEEKNFTMPRLFAGLIGAIVENKPLDESLREVGLSEDYVLKQLVATQSSDVAINYVRGAIAEQFGKILRNKSSKLYLVKKVLCDPSEYKAMARAVSGKHTDKFQVLRLIGSNSQLLNYKKENHGLEAYLVSSENPMEAMKETTVNNPTFEYNAIYFNADDAKELDGLINNAVYKHSPKTVEKLFNFMK